MTLAYRVLRFSPNPEEVEFINVALLLRDAGEHRIFYDHAFPKLNCIAPGFDRSLLASYLDVLQAKVHGADPETAARIILSSSQFKLTTTREFYDARRDFAIALLKEKYLERPEAQRNQRDGGSKQIESKLQDFLGHLGLPAENMLRRAAPGQFLSDEVAKHLGGNGFRVPRVANGRHHLVLIDGVSIGASHYYLQSRASKIAFGYFRINSVRRQIRDVEKRDLLRAVILFVPPHHHFDPHEEFALETIRRDSDQMFDASRPDPKFEQMATEAARDLV